MARTLQGFIRTLLALGLCVLCFVVGRYGGHQAEGARTGEFVAVGAGVLGLTAWSWRQTPPAYGAAEFTANLIRHGLTLAGAVIAAVLCLGAALLGVWMQHA
jgi:hypothetical protein